MKYSIKKKLYPVTDENNPCSITRLDIPQSGCCVEDDDAAALIALSSAVSSTGSRLAVSQAARLDKPLPEPALMQSEQQTLHASAAPRPPATEVRLLRAFLPAHFI